MSETFEIMCYRHRCHICGFAWETDSSDEQEDEPRFQCELCSESDYDETPVKRRVQIVEDKAQKP